MRVLILACILLSGCGRDAVTRQGVLIPELQPFLDAFQASYRLKVERLDFSFETLERPKVGECVQYDDASKPWVYNQVILDHAFWSESSDSVRTELLTHELLHCLVNAVHNSAILADECPASVMYPFVFGEPCLSRHDYVTEFRK